MKEFFLVSIDVYHIGEKDIPKSNLVVGLYEVEDPEGFRKLLQEIMPMNKKNRRLPPQRRASRIREELKKRGYVLTPLQQASIIIY